MKAFVIVVGLFAFPAIVSSNPLETNGTFQHQCASLEQLLDIADADYIETEYVERNTTLRFPASDASCNRPSQLVSTSFCRVVAQIATSPRSSVRMEAWLPANWTGRFLSTGNGGLGGCIQYEDMDYAAALGFATVGTNNGHDGSSGESFLNNPDVIEDFAYRAVHTGVVTGKYITKSFYGKQLAKSYYLGCSTGGRQGFKEAQKFPEDFDGIVAGAPAFAFNNLTSWSSHFLPITGPAGSETFVPLSIWPVVHQDVLDQCDALDGVADNILESPDMCKYDPSGLLCANGQKDGCLTPLQLQSLQSLYTPLLGKDGSLIYPRMQPGAELTGVAQTYFTGQPFGAADWFRYAILNDSSWDPSTLSEEDYVLSSTLNLFNIETWDGDLSAFQRAGGKLLHYHGLMDQTISSENSPRYYEHVSRTMDLQPEQLDDFYRYFRISGMAHCSGGSGAAWIGNGPWNTASYDPSENVLMAMVRWVEEGIAPETVTGTAYVNGTQSAGIDFKRRHCRWPYRNQYKGYGDAKDENNWSCELY